MIYTIIKVLIIVPIVSFILISVSIYFYELIYKNYAFYKIRKRINSLPLFQNNGLTTERSGQDSTTSHISEDPEKKPIETFSNTVKVIYGQRKIRHIRPGHGALVNQD